MAAPPETRRYSPRPIRTQSSAGTRLSIQKAPPAPAARRQQLLLPTRCCGQPGPPRSAETPAPMLGNRQATHKFPTTSRFASATSFLLLRRANPDSILDPVSRVLNRLTARGRRRYSRVIL